MKEATETRPEKGFWKRKTEPWGFAEKNYQSKNFFLVLNILSTTIVILLVILVANYRQVCIEEGVVNTSNLI